MKQPDKPTPQPKGKAQQPKPAPKKPTTPPATDKPAQPGPAKVTDIPPKR